MLGAIFGCKKEARVVGPASATSTTMSLVTTPCGTVTAGEACVTLKMTGLAHLVDGTDPAKLRTLVVPNLTTAGHTTYVLTTSDFVSGASDHGLLDQEDEQLLKGQTRGSGTTFRFREFPAGHEIDLEHSGWTKPASPTLVLDESGDPDADCPATVSPDSLHWLPRLSVVSKFAGGATLKDAFTKKDPSASDVVTRLEFVDGKLTVGLEALTPDVFAFARNGVEQLDDHVQAVASDLNYSFKAQLRHMTVDGVAEDVFVLVGREFTANTLVDIARFKPNNGRVLIHLANVVRHDFFNPAKMSKNEHFQYLYGIFDTTGASPAPTVPVRGAQCQIHGDAGVECGPDRVP